MAFRTQIHTKNSVKMVLYSTGYYVPLPIDQFLKFKNHCSLLYSQYNNFQEAQASHGGMVAMMLKSQGQYFSVHFQI
jgi:hypothetical protein